MKYEIVLLSKVHPDENQPRKYFPADKLNQLKESIKREGIISPLIVEKIGDGFLILDGERRYRVAVALKLKEVPVIIEDVRNSTDRLVRQFTVQEQHEGWTPLEKATALIKLSEELDIGLSEVCKLLNVSPGVTRHYVAFARLADKQAYMKSEIPLEYASYINSVRNIAHKESNEQLKKEFTKQDEKRLERKIIADIKTGTIQKRDQISKLGFAFIKDPKTIETYMDKDSATAEGLFLSSGAQGARALRSLSYDIGYLKNHMTRFTAQPDVKVPDVLMRQLKDTKNQLEAFITRFDSEF